MTYPVFASSNGGTTTAVTYNFPLPATIASGSYIVIISYSTATPNTPSGYTSLVNDSLTRAFYRVADGTEGGTTVPITIGSSTWYYVECCVVTGASGIEAEMFSGTSANPNPPSITASWGANTNLVVAAAISGASITAGPSGYSGFIQYISNKAALAWKETASATEDPGAFTASSSVYRAWTFVFKPVVSSNSIFFGSNF